MVNHISTRNRMLYDSKDPVIRRLMAVEFGGGRDKNRKTKVKVGETMRAQKCANQYRQRQTRSRHETGHLKLIHSNFKANL